MAVLKTHFNSNPNVGLYGYANNNYCLLPLEVKTKEIKKAEEALEVPVHKINICGTSLLGVFLVGNNNCLLVPPIAFDRELKKLDKYGIKYQVIDTDFTALGNNIIANDKIALVNPELEEKAKKQIAKALNVEVKDAKISELSNLGALIAFNSKGGLISNECKEFEKKLIEKSLSIKCEIGSVNSYSTYIRSGIIVNDNGFIVGALSTPLEINDADAAFGFLKNG